MTDRIPGAPGRCKAVVAGEELQKMQAGEEFAITLRRDDQPIAGGTPYNKASVLPDDLAQKLCPEVEDPAPKDAFLALHNQKADTGKSQTGEKLTITDAANAPLLGLKIYGKDTPEGTVGESGHVTVKVGGKNIADLRKFSTKPIRTATTTATKDDAGYGTTLSATTGNSVTVTQSKWPNTTMLYHSSNGFVVLGFYCPLRVGEYATISFDYEITNNPLNVVGTDLALQWNTGYQNNASVKNNRIYESRYIDASTAPTADGWNYLSFALAGTSGVISNFQVAYGSANVDYEPYQEPQTITVPTPGGLPGGNDIADEIDFAKGVLIQRVREQSETPLPEDVLAAYAKLRTYAPTTIITNDEEADMEARYCTPNTAVLVSEDLQGQWLHEELEGNPGEGVYKKLGSGILVAHGNFRCGVIGMLPEISGPEDYRLQSAIRFPAKFSMPPVITVLMSDSGGFGLTDFKVTKVEKDFVEFEMKSKMGRDVYAEISVSAIGTWK